MIYKSKISKIRMMAAALGVLAVASCSDREDFNTVPDAADPAAERTLWENISTHPDLEDFTKVLVRLGYDKVLDASHTYTVWAPVDGSFNMDSLSQVSDAKVEKEFLKNMIADFSHRETDLNDTVVYMLNEKLLKFTGKNTASLAFDGQPVLANASIGGAYNYPSTNGLLYVVSAPSVFRYNAYEYIAELEGVADSLIAYVKKYEQILLDEEASVKGPIKDGLQHYDDSVLIVNNSFTKRRLNAQLENEDSLYTVMIPTNEAWEEAYGRYKSYYNYIPEIDWQDLDPEVAGGVGSTKGNKGTIMAATVGKKTATLTVENPYVEDKAGYLADSMAKYRMTNWLAFSETNRYNARLAAGLPLTRKDTLVVSNGGHIYNSYGDDWALDRATSDIVKLSNGHARLLSFWPINPLNILESKTVGRCLTASGYSYSDAKYQRHELDPAVCTLEEGQEQLRYIRTDLPEKSSQVPELDIYLNGVLSTTYDIYAVIVPACVEDTGAVRKPYSLFFDINYTDANNTQIAGRFNGERAVTLNQDKVAAIKKVEPFIVQPDKVDTLKLGRVTFPICYVGTDAKPNIKVMHSVSAFTSKNRELYEQILRIACIRMVPVTEED